MQGFRFLLAIGALALFVTGCAGVYATPVMPPGGLLYSEIQAPVTTEPNNSQLGKKVGRAMSKSVLGWIATGDCSIASAARNGGIKTVRHVDYEMKNILGVYSEFTIVVYGD